MSSPNCRAWSFEVGVWWPFPPRLGRPGPSVPSPAPSSPHPERARRLQTRKVVTPRSVACPCRSRRSFFSERNRTQFPVTHARRRRLSESGVLCDAPFHPHRCCQTRRISDVSLILMIHAAALTVLEPASSLTAAPPSLPPPISASVGTRHLVLRHGASPDNIGLAHTFYSSEEIQWLSRSSAIFRISKFSYVRHTGPKKFAHRRRESRPPRSSRQKRTKIKKVVQAQFQDVRPHGFCLFPQDLYFSYPSDVRDHERRYE